MAEAKGTTKQYGKSETYEQKIAAVMKRFGVKETEYDYNFNRTEAYVSFIYKGKYYRFEHSITNAKAHGQNIRYGSDIFAQVVLSLEDLARMAERGIYDLQIWLSGFSALPPGRELPVWVSKLGLADYPQTLEELDAVYKARAKIDHPDTGGSQDAFVALEEAYRQAAEYISKK